MNMNANAYNLIHQLHHLVENSNSNINNLHLLIMKGRTNQHYYKHNTTAIINILSKRSFEMAPPHIINQYNNI